VDFPDLLNAIAANHFLPLPETFGQAFASSGYDGAVIFRSPWTTGASPTRAYQIYPLHSIAFWWDEVNSGVREKFSAALLLQEESREGQTARDVFPPDPKENVISDAAIVRIMPAQNDNLLMDLTDGSEWSVPQESLSRCNLKVGTGVFIASFVSVSGDRSPVSVSGPKRCALDAVFVKGW